MNTTVAIIEILVVGLFGSAWILLAVMRAGGIEWSAVAVHLNHWQDWSTTATVIGTLAAYQVGWLMNGLSRGLMWPLAKRERNRILGGSKEYEVVRAAVYQTGSARVNDDLALEQSVIRLARGGLVNFSSIALLLVTSGAGRARLTVAVVFLVLALGCALQWRHRNRRYYERILTEYKTLPQSTEVKPNKPLQPTSGAGASG